MFRYVTFAWDSRNPLQQQAARKLLHRWSITSQHWSRAIEVEGLAVYYTGARSRSAGAYDFANGQGVVLGKLFRQSDDTVAIVGDVVLGSRESADIMSSGGKYLMERFWGSYVGFAHDPANGATWVFRDPTAGLPCFETSVHNVKIFFSDIEDCCAIGLRFSINLDYVGAQLAQRNIVECRETGLTEVSKLLGGESVRIHKDGVARTFCWDPRDISKQHAMEDHKEAVAQLRRTMRACIHGWASCYDSILHLLSGGLDSSILLSCLQDAPTCPRITCLNLYSSIDSISDERAFARVAAEHACCELLEVEHSTAVSLEPLRQTWPSARPTARHIRYLLAGRLLAESAAEKECEATFSGELGDELFFKSHVILAAGDYAWHHGFRRPLLDVVLDVARLEGLSIWTVIRRGVVPGLLQKPRWNPEVGRVGDPNQTDNVLVAAELRTQREGRFTHPWLHSANGVATGKLQQIRLMCCQSTLDGRAGNGGALEYVIPLRSQPLIELCLRIPTYLQVKGGWDRSIARRAFADRLPREIITRRTKGGGGEYHKAVLSKNIGFLREFLLDGVLINSGMVDRAALEIALSRSPSEINCLVPDLLEVLTTEAWLRSWRIAAPQNVAADDDPHLDPAPQIAKIRG